MNKETTMLYLYITNNPEYLQKIKDMKIKYSNIKDFTNIFGYVIMEIINKEYQFLNISRKNIDIDKLSLFYFGGNDEF